MNFLFRSLGFSLLFVFFINAFAFSANPGAQYGCLLSYSSGIVYTSYSNDGLSPEYNDGKQYPFYFTTPNKTLNKNTGGSSEYMCGEINTGFTPQDIDFSSSPGICYVNGITQHGDLRQYSITPCNAPIDDNASILVIVMSCVGAFLIRREFQLNQLDRLRIL